MIGFTFLLEVKSCHKNESMFVEDKSRKKEKTNRNKKVIKTRNEPVTYVTFLIIFDHR